MKRPAFQFYPADWRKDVALRSCSIAARGLWIDLMCIAHECEPYGHLTINGKPMNAAQIAGQVGLTKAQCLTLVDELIDSGTARQTPEGVIYSKRMVDDEDLRNRRAAGGQAGAEHGSKGAESGFKGGRPKIIKGGLETPFSGEKEPPPSSSSSSSVTPIPPRGPKTSAVGLKAWVIAEREAGRKLIPDDDPVFAYAAEVGLPSEFLSLAWAEFKHNYSRPDAKRYRDWRDVFRRAVRGNWAKLWWLDANGTYALTTAGEQARRASTQDAA